MQRGEKAGFPRYKGRNRFHSFTYKEYGNGARWIMVFWSSPRSGASVSTGLAPSRAGPRRSRSRRRPMAGMSRSPAPTCPYTRSPPTGQETGIDLGLESFVTLANGQRFAPRPTTASPRRICAAASGASPGARRAATADAKPSSCWPKRISTFARQRRDFHHKEAGKLVRSTTRSTTKTCGSATCSRTTISPRASAMRAGARSEDPHFQGCRRRKASASGESAFTSQRCSGRCGAMVAKGLSVRWHSCPDCGTSLHRDHNAALNILWLGQEQSRRGYGLRTPTWPVGRA